MSGRASRDGGDGRLTLQRRERVARPGSRAAGGHLGGIAGPTSYARADDWIEQTPAPRERAGSCSYGATCRASDRPPPEIADWAGLKQRPVDETLEGLNLRRFRGREGRPPRRSATSAPARAHTPAPVRFLPTGTRRSWSTPAAPRSPRGAPGQVFGTKTPQSIPTFTVDVSGGQLRYEKEKVRLSPSGGEGRAR